jgi:hypothetical protein
VVGDVLPSLFTHPIGLITGWNEVKSVAELVGWALPDGKLQPPVTLPFNESVFVGVGQTLGWYSQDNYMIVGGRVGGQAPKGNHALGFVGTKKGESAAVWCSRVMLPHFTGLIGWQRHCLPGLVPIVPHTDCATSALFCRSADRPFRSTVGVGRLPHPSSGRKRGV